MSGRSKSKQRRRNARKLKRHLGTLSLKGKKLFLCKKKGPAPVKRTKPFDPIEKLIEANNTICIVTGLSYDKAIELRDELRIANIDANITTGGLQIYKFYKNKGVLQICKKYKTIPEPGVSRFVEAAYLGTMKCQQPR